MGATSSKKQKGVPVNAAVPRPSLPPQPPYSGPPVTHHFVNINASLDINARFNFLNPDVSINSTNIESYYPHLVQKYREGLRLLVFVALPGSTQTYGLAAMGQTHSTVKFQGVFRNPPEEEASQQWDLRVEKSVLFSQMFHSWGTNIFLDHSSGNLANPNHIFQTIDRVTRDGGRLVGIEMTGMAGQEMEMQMRMAQHHRQRRNPFSFGGMYPAMQVGVDIFYEVPVAGSTERYVYQIVNDPLVSTFVHSMPHGKWSVQCNWQNVFQQYMGCGWKIVEIFVDMSQTQQMQGFGAVMRNNCMWIFEKPQSRLNDQTPLYEGTMVEFWFTTKMELHSMGFGGASVHVNTDWEQTINHMAQYGWEVVGIVQTPETNIQGMFNPTVLTKCLIFFQRKLASQIQNVPPLPQSTVSGAQPPSYGELYNEDSKRPM